MAEKEQNSQFPQVSRPLSGCFNFCSSQTHMIVKLWDLVTMINRWALGVVTPSLFHALYYPFAQFPKPGL